MDGEETRTASSFHLKLASAKIRCQVVCSCGISPYVNPLELLLAVTTVVTFVYDVTPQSQLCLMGRLSVKNDVRAEQNDRQP